MRAGRLHRMGQQTANLAWSKAASATPAASLHRSGEAGSLNKLFQVVAQQQPGQSLSQEQVREVCRVIESISLEDLGVDAALGQPMTYGTATSARELRARLRPKGSRGTVTYLDIHDDPTMTIGIFQLPPGARMPLHDHPGMTVFSRLLYGTLHVRAYDWVQSPPDGFADGGSSSSPTSSDASSSSSTTCEPGLSSSGAANGINGGGSAPGNSSSSSIQPARLVTDRVLTAPADTMVLFPQSGGNIHAFTAISPCAILDVLTPPYGNRNCTYYREVFPPQWMDAQGQPALVPSEDVAHWVAWQAAGQAAQCGAGADGGGPGPPPPQQQQQQLGGGDDGGSVLAAPYPPAASAGPGGCEDIIVGLEVWREPSDFHVARGTYLGQRVTVAGAGRAAGGV